MSQKGPLICEKEFHSLVCHEKISQYTSKIFSHCIVWPKMVIKNATKVVIHGLIIKCHCIVYHKS